MMNKAPNIRVSYDNIADVLYLTAANGARTNNREEEAGLVVRYDSKTQKPVGATVIDYKEYWLPQQKHLIEVLAKLLGLGEKDVKSIIRAAYH